MPTEPLNYLIFDASEGDDGLCTFDALATVRSDQREAVNAEAQRVAAWMRAHMPHGPGPVEDGHAWDEDLVWLTEAQGGEPWHTLSITYTIVPTLAQEFADQWVS